MRTASFFCPYSWEAGVPCFVFLPDADSICRVGEWLFFSPFAVLLKKVNLFAQFDVPFRSIRLTFLSEMLNLFRRPSLSELFL